MHAVAHPCSRLTATGVRGGVPEAYCRAPFAAQLITL